MILVNLDVMMAKRKMSLNELSARVDISLANLSILKNNKCKAIRFSTLSALCRALECGVNDLLEYAPDAADTANTANAVHADSAGKPGAEAARKRVDSHGDDETEVYPA